MIASSESLGLVVSGHCDLAAEHHNPNVEVMRVQIFAETGLLATMHNLQALTAQVAFESLTAQKNGP